MYTHTHTHTHAHEKEGPHPPGLLQTPDRTRRHTDTDTHTHKHTQTHTHTRTHAELLTKALIARAIQKTTKRRGVAYQNRSTLEQLCLSAAIWFPSPCLFVDATQCMSRTVIDGPKRCCPRIEGLTNQLPIKLHQLDDVRLVCPRIEGLTNQRPIKLQQLEDVRLVLIVFHERWTAGVGGSRLVSRLVITLAGGDERWTAAVGGSRLVIILAVH